MQAAAKACSGEKGGLPFDFHASNRFVSNAGGHRKSLTLPKIPPQTPRSRSPRRGARTLACRGAGPGDISSNPLPSASGITVAPDEITITCSREAAAGNSRPTLRPVDPIFMAVL